LRALRMPVGRSFLPRMEIGKPNFQFAADRCLASQGASSQKNGASEEAP
jgi:hypothetical protein